MIRSWEVQGESVDYKEAQREDGALMVNAAKLVWAGGEGGGQDDR